MKLELGIGVGVGVGARDEGIADCAGHRVK